VKPLLLAEIAITNRVSAWSKIFANNFKMGLPEKPAAACVNGEGDKNGILTQEEVPCQLRDQTPNQNGAKLGGANRRRRISAATAAS
jgi:hypothetical protein